VADATIKSVQKVSGKIIVAFKSGVPSKYALASLTDAFASSLQVRPSAISVELELRDGRRFLDGRQTYNVKYEVLVLPGTSTPAASSIELRAAELTVNSSPSQQAFWSSMADAGLSVDSVDEALPPTIGQAVVLLDAQGQVLPLTFPSMTSTSTSRTSTTTLREIDAAIATDPPRKRDQNGVLLVAIFGAVMILSACAVACTILLRCRHIWKVQRDYRKSDRTNPGAHHDHEQGEQTEDVPEWL